MNSADYVDGLIADFKQQIERKEITRSYAIFQTGIACVGWSYVYSAWGDLCTPAERRKRFKMCPTHTTIKTKCKGFNNGVCTGCQWLPDGKRTRCSDCRGFQDWLFKMYGFDLYGDTVATQWNHKDNWCKKGTIGVDAIPQNVYVSLFIKKDGKWTHTGGYYNGSTIECSNCVQYYKTMAKNRWTHWAIAKCFASSYEEPPKEQEKPMTNNNNLPTLRKGSKGEYVTLLQTKLANLGYNLGKSGVDGDFGSATLAAVKQFQKDRGLKADGVVGEKTWQALNNTAEPQKMYTVTIKGLTRSVADEIISKYGGTLTAE